jgi:lipid-binding SYLF domain-containing protein
MYKKLTSLLLITAGMVLALPTTAATREEQRVLDATEALNEFLRIPEEGIPPRLLSSAYAIAVVPNTVKAAFGVGGRHGRGIMVVRREDNTWSNPAFVRITGGGFGFQVGAQSSDIVLVFKSRRGVDGITSGKLTLGADASLAAGPVGRHSSAATDFKLQAEIFSYSRSRGLFAGIALEGTGVMMDQRANTAFYASPDITPDAIFESPAGRAPASANAFVELLTAQTSRLPVGTSVADSPAEETGEAPAPQPEPEPEPPQDEVKTYGIPGPDDAE